MRARDIMVAPVVTVDPAASVQDVANLLVAKRISAVPVTDAHGHVVGIVSEGDLIHRKEAGTERRRSAWLHLLISDKRLASEFIKSHACRVEDIMTRSVATASPETPLHEVASLMEDRHIKRVPIVDDDHRLVGIISRSNLVQAMAVMRPELDVPISDMSLREQLFRDIGKQDWADTALINITVKEGVVDLWGFARSDIERKAIRIAAKSTPGVVAVNDHLKTGEMHAG